MRTATLLIAHGSRRDAANEELRQLAALLREREPQALVEVAYLELAEPTIPQGVAACVARGAEQVKLLPYFLSAGMHVTRDLEDYRRRFAKEYADVDFVLCPPVGLHPLMVDIVMDRLSETSRPASNSEESNDGPSPPAEAQSR